MADKKLNITADLKVKTTEAERAIKRLQKQGAEISKVLKGLDIATSGGRAGFAKQLATANKEMLKLKGVTGDTAKSMEYLWGRQIEKQTKNLDRYTKMVDSLNKRFKGFADERGDALIRGDTDRALEMKIKMNRTAKRIATTEASRQATEQNIKDLKAGDAEDKRRDNAALAIAISNAVGQSLVQGLGVAQMMKVAPVANLAAAQSVHGGLMRRIAGGNFQDAFFFNRARNNGGGVDDATGQGIGRTLNAAQNVLAPFGNAVGALANGGGLTGAAASAVGAIPAAGANLIAYNGMGGDAAEEAQTLNARFEAARRTDPLASMVMENLQATAHMRRDASRRLGSRHMGVAGIGAGNGLDMGEAMSSGMGMAEQFGGGMVTGQNFRNWRSVMGAESRGFNRDAAGQMIGSFEMASKGSGEKQLNRIMAAGVKAGLEGVNIQFFERFGQAVAAEAFGQGGASSGGNFSEALMFGMNKNSTMADVQGNIGGQQALSKMLSGGNPFFNAVGLELGKNILGGGASGIKMQAFQSASLRELMSDKNEELDALGIGKGERRRMLEGKLDALTRSHLSENTEEGQYLLGGAQKAGGMRNFLSGDERARQLMASVLKATQPEQFGDYKSALGGVNFIAGIDSKEAKGGILGKQGDGMAVAQIQSQSRVMQRIWAEESKLRNELVASMKTSVESFKELAKINTNWDAAAQAVDVLNRVYDTLVKIGELPGFQDRKPPEPPKSPEKRVTFAPGSSGAATGSTDPNWFSPGNKF